MKLWTAPCLLIAAVACGGAEETPPPVSAAAEEERVLVEKEPGVWSADAAKAPAVSAAAPHPSIATCLGLVGEQRWVEAVAPCSEAARRAPDSAEVAEALAQARAGVAEQAAAKAQGALQKATGAASDATREAASQLEKLGGAAPEPDAGSLPIPGRRP